MNRAILKGFPELAMTYGASFVAMCANGGFRPQRAWGKFAQTALAGLRIHDAEPVVGVSP